MDRFRTISEAIVILGLIVFANMALTAEKAYKCDASKLVMNCDSLSQYYGLANGKCHNEEYGNKLCRSGWDPLSAVLEYEAVEKPASFHTDANGGRYTCYPADGYVTSYTPCTKDNGQSGYLGELV